MIALLIAATSPELNLRGVTCVAGNVEIHHVARNTGKVLRMVGRGDVPVSIGAARPLQRRLRTAPDTHGPTGTGYVELRGEDRALGHDRVHRDSGQPLPRRAREPASGRDVDRRARAADEPRGRRAAGHRSRRFGARGDLDGRHARGAREHDRDRRVERLRRPRGDGGLPRGRRDPPHLPARRHPGRRVHDGGPRRPARNAPDRHRPRRRSVLCRLPSRGRWDRRRVPARPGRADRARCCARTW